MAIYDTPNFTTGIDEAIVDTATTVPLFVPMMLLFIFGVVLFGGINSQKRRSGWADIPMWCTVASLSTLLVSLPMTMVSGMLNLSYLAIIVAITIASGVWLFLDRNRNEV